MPKRVDPLRSLFGSCKVSSARHADVFLNRKAVYDIMADLDRCQPNIASEVMKLRILSERATSRLDSYRSLTTRLRSDRW
jgi:hypothetical protein